MPTPPEFYLSLPAWLQPAAISVYGWHLKRIRTGGVYRVALAEFAARDGFSAEQWHDWQREALAAVLRRAVERVPFYRDLHRAGRYPIEEVRDPADLALLPTITKDDLRTRPEAFLADDVRGADLVCQHTSGTTGTPLRLWASRDALQRWYAAVEQRMRRWNSLHDGMRYATLGSRTVVPLERRQPPYWRYNRPGRQLYMSVFHLAPYTLDAYLDALKRYRITYLYGFGSALDALASHALARGRTDVRLAAAISNAEPFLDHWREHVEQAFGCRSIDTYAASEQTFACFEFGRTMYVSPDIGILEVIRDDGTPAAPDEVGEVCGTGLLNQAFMLIRYRQGDRAALAPAGRRGDGPFDMPMLTRIDGRCDDVLTTPDGRLLGRLDGVFKAGVRVREGQLALLAPNVLEARVLPAAGYSDTEDGREIERLLAARLGPGMHVRVRAVDAIPRGPNGKFRFLVREDA